MPERFDPDQILARNPQLNKRLLEEAQELGRRLQEMGIQRKGYSIVSPFKRRDVPSPHKRSADTVKKLPHIGQ